MDVEGGPRFPTLVYVYGTRVRDLMRVEQMARAITELAQVILETEVTNT